MDFLEKAKNLTNWTQNRATIKKKTAKLVYIQIKNLCLLKYKTKSMRRQATRCEKVLAIHLLTGDPFISSVSYYKNQEEKKQRA